MRQKAKDAEPMATTNTLSVQGTSEQEIEHQEVWLCFERKKVFLRVWFHYYLSLYLPSQCGDNFLADLGMEAYEGLDEELSNFIEPSGSTVSEIIHVIGYNIL